MKCLKTLEKYVVLVRDIDKSEDKSVSRNVSLCEQAQQRKLFMGVRRGKKWEFPLLEIGTKKEKFLENVKSAV